MKYYVRQIRKYARGDVIFSENSPCDGMYIIDSGRVRVFKTNVEGNKKTEVELCTLGSKAMFGEMGMIDESPRSATVQALEPTVCTLITKQIFEDQLGKIPPWMVNMIRILVSRLRETNEKLTGMVEKQSPQYVSNDADGVLTTIDESDGGFGDTLAESQKIIESLFVREEGKK